MMKGERMAIWTVDATVSVTVEAETEAEAVDAGTDKIERMLASTELEAFDYNAWQA